MNRKVNIIQILFFLVLTSAKSLIAQTTFNPGDVAILGINANNFACGGAVGEDVVTFVAFQDIVDNTEIDVSDNGWERVMANRFGDSEGTYRLTRTGGTIAAGTSFDFRFTNDLVSTQAANPDWTVSNINVPSTLERNVNLNSGGDQIFVMQNGTWDNMGETGEHDATYDGDILYGFNTRTTWAADGTSQQSNLPPELDPCYFMNPTGGTTNYINYTGPTSPATQLEWINRIGDPANWTTFGDCSAYNSNPPPSSITIEPSGISVSCSDCSGCAPFTTDISFNLPSSGGPFNVVYEDGTTEFTLNGISNGHTESVTVNSSTTYRLVSVTDVNGCPVYSNFDGDAELIVTSGPTASITGGGDLCVGSCVTIDISITGGNSPYDVEMNINAGPLLDFDFTVPTPDLNTTVTICSEGLFPDFDIPTLTLTVPELPGVSATLTLIGISDDSGCVGTVDPTPLNITIRATPDANPAGPLNECDNGSGEAVFDLTSLDNTVNGGTGDDVDWWSDSDATMAISSPYTTTSTTVYATVSNAFCTSESVAVELVVDPIPEANSTTSELCDEGLGLATFNLGALEGDVNGGSGNPVNWYSDIFGDNPINSPYITPSTTVYAEVDDGNCLSGLVPVDLIVLDLPFVQSAGPLQECDQGSGIATFDLTVLETDISGGQGNAVSWYSDQQGNNSISSPFVSPTATVYATTFDGTCESNTVAIELEVIPQPIANPADEELCGDENNEADFDLTALEDDVNENSSLPVSWYSDQDTTDEIFSPYQTTSTTVYAVVTEGNCRSEEVPVNLTVLNTPQIDPFDIVTECGFYILPEITGNNLTGSEIYYDDSGGSGFPYNPGDTIFESITVYAYDINMGMCADEQALEINIESGADAGEDNSVSVCVGSVIDLTDVLVDADIGGGFTDDDNTGALNGSMFDSDGLEGSTYQFTYTVVGGGNCPDDQAMIFVDVVSEVSAGDDQTGLVCAESAIDLTTVLVDADPGGSFVDVDNTGGLSGSMFNTQGLTSGFYQFEYNIGDGVVCPEDQSLLTIEVVDQPQLSVVGPIQLCDGDCGEVELTFLVGTPGFNYTLNYTSNSGIDQSIPQSIPSTSQIITVCNTSTGNAYSNDTLYIDGSEGSVWNLDFLDVEDLNCTNSSGTIRHTIEAGANSISDFNPSLCPGENITVGNTVYDENNLSGTEILLNSIGCDSIINVSIDFYPEATFDYTSTLCFGQSIDIGGEIFDENNPSGMVDFPGASVNGCDSLVIVDLSFADAAYNNVQDQLCPSESILVNGVNYNFNNPTGSDTLIGGSSTGCDSIILVDLSFFTLQDGIVDDNLCSGESIIINGTTYDENNPTGTEVIFGGSSEGCDSMIQIDLQFDSEVFGNLNTTLCPGEILVVNGTTYDETNTSGTETFVNGSVAGCDSVVTVDLSFFQAATSDVTSELCPGESLDINGTIYDEGNPTGTEILLGASSNGCDSLVNIQLSFTQVSIDFEPVNLECINSQTNPIDLEVIVVGSPEFGSWSGMGVIDVVTGLFDPNVFVTENTDEIQVSYTLTENGCAFSETLTISPENIVIGDFGQMQPNCDGDGAGAIFANSVFGTGNLQYSIDGSNWYDVNDTIFGLQPGVYTVTLENQNGCSDMSTLEILDVFIPFVDAGADIDMNLGDSQQITAISDANPISISWAPSAGLSCTDCLDPIASPLVTTDYEITIIDADGCVITDQIRVTVRVSDGIFFPNVFSPNRDQINDYFFPQVGDEFAGVLHMNIYDRWGNMLFSKNDIQPNIPEEGWDGTFLNNDVNPGVYVYQLQFILPTGDIRTITGDITLVR